MKKSKFLITSIALLTLVACNDGKSTSTSQGGSDLNQDSVSKDSTSEIPSTPKEKKEIMQDFLIRLLDMDGHVVSTNQTIEATDYYLTNSFPFTMTTKQISTTTRYVDKDGNPIVVEEGQIGFADDVGEEPNSYDKYVSQKTQDDRYLYHITDYENPSTNDRVQTYLRSNTDVIFFNVGFPMSEYENIMFMITYLDSENYNFEISNFDEIVDNGVWEYEYEATFYELENGIPTKYPKEVHRYKNKLTIENGIITKLDQESDVELYSGGIKVNWSKYYIKREYLQGDYQIFEGTIFNPNDYK